MPLGLLKYGLSKDFPFEKEADLPAPKDLKRHYDVVIIGGGGHGVATAYYLAKYHGITNVAVLEKGYLGGGNTARNTAVIRSNYLTPEGVKFYSASVKLYEDLSNEFDFNIMYSQRGQLTLAHTDATVRAFRQRAEVKQAFWWANRAYRSVRYCRARPHAKSKPGELTSARGSMAQGRCYGATRRSSLGLCKGCNATRRRTPSTHGSDRCRH